jgi:galactose mutarotase-like enzyme
VAGDLRIGGAPIVALREARPGGHGPAFVSAEVLPGRGMMLLQAGLRLPSGEVVDALHAPPAVDAAHELDGGPDDFAGNAAFAFGGAILAPYANRITGQAIPGAREIETVVDGGRVRLPRNWGGRAPGARQYAMHGLILDAKAHHHQASPDRVTGNLAPGHFGGRWPSRTEIEFEWRLADGALELTVTARNVGREPLPFGIGWHPYFALPSERREQARLRLPAASRAEVDNYDEVLPTGRLLPTAGSDYDFNAADGRALGDLYLDDCFTDLVRQDGAVLAEVRDPAAGIGLRITSPSPQVRAVQVYAPPDRPFVAVEPQFNLADPFSPVWPPGVDTGMARLAPGQTAAYQVRVEPFAL